MDIIDSEIHLWHADQRDFELPALTELCLTWLSEKELARFQRLQFEAHRKQLLLGRFLMRSVLSMYAPSIEMGQWQFQYNDYGKPELAATQSELGLFFNLSHSGDKLVFAVSTTPFLGVDVERCDKPRRLAKIADRYFSATESAALLALPQAAQLHRFYELWTLKEAYIKACGMGLAIPLQHFSYDFPDRQGIDISFDSAREDRPGDWQFWQLDMAEPYQLSLAAKSAVERGITTLSSWRLTSLEDFHSLDSVVGRSS